jgi:peptide/nickel transport system ATP-binding protein
MGPLVDFRNVRMYFRSRRGLLRTALVKAVDGVSLTISRGETLALVGESGSGKTTLGRLALGLLKPTSGTILFDGKDITRMEKVEHSRFRRRCQAIFQDPYSSLNPFMTVGEIVEEPLIIHGLQDRRRRVLRALEDVGLEPPEEFSRKHIFTLSGGQRQRVAIARALVLQPEFIVADEPVSMIDASSRAEVLLLLHKLKREHGITFLYITHDIATARHFSDRIAVMYLGRVVELGPTQSVVEKPMHPYTVSLIEAVPEPRPDNLERDLYAIPGEPPSAENIPGGCRFHPRCPFYMNALCDAVDPPLTRVGRLNEAACLLHQRSQRNSLQNG